MSRNGSGTYTLPAGNPVVTGTTITSSWANTSLSDIAAALTQSVAADGQTPMTGNLNMTNNIIENVADATASGDAVSLNFLQTGTYTISGAATFADGSAAAPSITNTGDTNTGIFFPAADTIAFTEGGVESMRIDSAGNVGIGTSSPSTKFHVANNANSATTITVSNTNAGASASANAKFTNSASSGEFGQLSTTFAGYGALVADATYIYAGNNRPITIATDNNYIAFGAGTGGTERMRIDSSGNVGIGGTAANAYKLEIVGSSQNATTIGQTYAGVGAAATKVTSGGAWAVGVDNANGATERMRIDSGGELILIGSTAQKATGTTWSNPSDIRLKDNIEDYAKGLPELMQVKVKTWEYNGKGGTIAGTKGLGVVADEIKEILPDTVDNYKAKLNADDAEDSDIKKFDATEITWLMLKSIQEQQAMITELKATVDAQAARIAALENK
jgi:hypothetical protein